MLKGSIFICLLALAGCNAATNAFTFGMVAGVTNSALYHENENQPTEIKRENVYYLYQQHATD